MDNKVAVTSHDTSERFVWRRKHLLGLQDLTRQELIHILDTADGFKDISRRSIKKAPTLRGKVVVNLFFEDSTRTRTSFSLAASRLSADVLEFSAKGSSVSKGETLRDTARPLGVATYRLPPEELKASLPTPEELEAELNSFEQEKASQGGEPGR